MEGTLFLALMVLPMMLVGGVIRGCLKNDLMFGVGAILITAYPLLFALWRVDVFNEGTIPKYVGPKMIIDLGPGYCSIFYWIFSFLAGLNTTAVGIANLTPYLASGKPPLTFCLAAIILGLIIQSIIMCPDKIDPLAPVDLRMKKGYIYGNSNNSTSFCSNNYTGLFKSGI